jgi:cell division protein FtsI (penicillin-binding protein 3)
MAIGQEVGVTPVQLVTMVSTIANGGVYMPPHILLQSTDEMKGDPRLKAAAFHPANQLPATLPDGAHRVISEMTSAKMRMMMQGIVVEGTGRRGALNGYSAGGKTGTAQKIDVATHTYSHTKLVASFTGFAPVSNPAISVAVVIDTPTVGTRYGAETSAPVFATVAQQVLEYLGVPHDQPLKTQKEIQIAEKDVVDDAPAESTADLTAMFDDVNSLPADDPLRSPASAVAATGKADEGTGAVAPKGAGVAQSAMNLLPAKVAAAFQRSPDHAPADAPPASSLPKAAPMVEGKEKGAVVVNAGLRVPVPSFEGAALRSVVEKADAVGLRVQAVGSGLAREQVPAAGTMVPAGTEVVVRFTR